MENIKVNFKKIFSLAFLCPVVHKWQLTAPSLIPYQYFSTAVSFVDWFYTEESLKVSPWFY